MVERDERLFERFWAWFYSSPHDPDHDPWHRKIGQKNLSGVTMLSGAISTTNQEEIKLKVTLKNNNPVFIPLNIVLCTINGGDGKTLEELSNLAKEDMDNASPYELKIDGIQYHVYRLGPHIFTLRVDTDISVQDFDPDNTRIPEGNTAAATDGYYIVLPAEAVKGKTITIKGKEFDKSINVTYDVAR